MSADVTVRLAAPSDADAVAALTRASADGGAVGFRLVEHVPSAMAVRPGERRIIAVAEWPGEGVVGSAALTLGRFHFARGERPYALLSSLVVDPGYRGRGVATALAAWRLRQAELETGSDVVVLADIQRGNSASLAVARRWATGFTSPILTVPMPMRTRQPRVDAGLRVRDAEPSDFGEICAALAKHHRERDFARIWTPASLTTWLAASPLPDPITRYRVAVDASDRIIGGLAVRDEGKVRSMEIIRLTPALQLANAVMRVLPSDRVLRNVTVEHLWHAPARLDAARALWEHTRWVDRDQGTTLVMHLDAADPVRRALGLRPWSPTTSSIAAVRADVAPSPTRILEPLI